MILDYIEAKKQIGGFYMLFYKGTLNHPEGFEHEKFSSAKAAREFYKVKKIKEGCDES